MGYISNHLMKDHILYWLFFCGLIFSKTPSQEFKVSRTYPQSARHIDNWCANRLGLDLSRVPKAYPFVVVREKILVHQAFGAGIDVWLDALFDPFGAFLNEQTFIDFVQDFWWRCSFEKNFACHGSIMKRLWHSNMGVSKNRGTPKWIVYTGKPN